MKGLMCFILASIILACSSISCTSNQTSHQGSVSKEIIDNQTIQSNAPNDVNNEYGKTLKFVVYDDPPVPIKQIRPIYTDLARRSGIEGDVWLEVEVLADGTVGAIEVKKSLLSGPGGLDEAAIKAVRQWKYSPATSGGKPVACWVTFPVSFSLD